MLIIVVWCGVVVLCVNIFGGGDTRRSRDKLLGCSFGGILLFERDVRVSASTEILVMVYVTVLYVVNIFVVTTVDRLDSRV